MCKNKRLCSVILAGLLLLSGCGKKTPGAALSEEKSAESSQSVGEAQTSSQNLEDLKSGYVEKGEWLDGADGKRWWKATGTFYDAFDTVISITLYTANEETFQRLYAAARAEYEHLHQLYDRYHAYEGVNNVYMINQSAGKEPVAVEDALFDLLAFGKEWAPVAQGKVNIAMGAVLELWHDVREAAGAMENGAPAKSSQKNGDTAPAKKAVLPTQEALEEAARHCAIDRVELDAANKTVYLPDAQMSLDVGSIAKGYATERVAQQLEQQAGADGVHGIINAGGNVRTLGAPIDGRTQWTIGVQDPRIGNADPLVALRVGADLSVVTSGDYQRYFVVDGKRYNHIIDPDTLYPGELYASVTVVAKDSGVSDFLSTAAFLMDEAQTEELQKAVQEKIGEKVDFLWIYDDERVERTQGIEIQ